MRKQITTFALAAAVITSTSAAVSAGGLAPVEVAPTVFVEEDEGSMESTLILTSSQENELLPHVKKIIGCMDAVWAGGCPALYQFRGLPDGPSRHGARA